MKTRGEGGKLGGMDGGFERETGRGTRRAIVWERGVRVEMERGKGRVGGKKGKWGRGERYREGCMGTRGEG